MKKGLLVGIGAVVLVVILVIGGLVGTYNGLVDKQAEVEKADAQIQTYLQRRADLTKLKFIRLLQMPVQNLIQHQMQKNIPKHLKAMILQFHDSW